MISNCLEKNLLIKETVDDLIENVIDLSVYNKDHEYFSRIKKDYCNPLISNTGTFHFYSEKL